jgi:hypothetical protein
MGKDASAHLFYGFVFAEDETDAALMWAEAEALLRTGWVP